MLILIVSLIMASISGVSAQNQGEDPSKPAIGASAEAGDGVPNRLEVNEGEGPFGPPEFSEGLNRLGIRHTVMERNRILINDRPLDCELPPVIIDGRVLVPARATCIALDADVVWDQDNRTITITRDDLEVVIVIDEEIITVNGEPFDIDIPAQIFSNRTFIPVKFIAEALGDEVEWDPQAREVHIHRGQSNKTNY